MARAERGFTLLEMLLALALMSLLATVLYSSLRVAFRARAIAGDAVDPPRTAAIAVELLRRDLESALPPTGILAGPFIGTDAGDGTSTVDADTLELHASIPDPTGRRSDVVRIELGLSTPDGEAEPALVRRVTTNLLAPQEPEPTEEVLCRRVSSFNVAYFDGSSWLDGWDSDATDNTLPVAVEVTLVLAAEGTASRPDSDYRVTRELLLPCSAPASAEDVTPDLGAGW